tara:strand:- start:3958 stop:5925 length:1968 start_codon:yes stop_codon:yes gene_type:complete
MAKDFKKMDSVEFGLNLLADQQAEFKAQARKAAKREERLMGLKLVTSGLSHLVKEKFNAFENSLQPQKIKLNNIYNSAQDIIATNKIIDTQYNGDAKAYFTNLYRTQLTNYGSQLYPDADPESLGHFTLQKAEELGNLKGSEWANVLKEARDLPTSVEGLQNNWDRYVKESVPTNVFSWATKGIKNFFSGKSPEQIEKEAQLSRDKLFNEDLFKDFIELETSYNNFKNIAPSESATIFKNLVDDYKEKNEKDVTFKNKVENVQVITQNKRNGTVQTYAVYTMKDNNSPTGRSFMSQEIGNYGTPNPREVIIRSDQQINVGLSTMKSELNNLGNEELIKLYDSYGEVEQRALGSNFLNARDSFLESANTVGIKVTQTQAEKLAVEYVLKSQEGTMTAYDGASILMERGELAFDTVLENFKAYYNDAQNNFGQKKAMEIYNDMYANIERAYQAKEITEDEREENLNQLNEASGQEIDFRISNTQQQKQDTDSSDVKIIPTNTKIETIVKDKLGEDKSLTDLEKIYKDISKRGGGVSGRYIDFFDLIPKMDLSNLSNDELEALYNFTDRFGKDALRKQLAIPDDYNFSEFAFQRNTFREAIEDVIKKREDETGKLIIGNYMYGDKRRQMGISLDDIFFKPLLELIISESQPKTETESK